LNDSTGSLTMPPSFVSGTLSRINEALRSGFSAPGDESLAAEYAGHYVVLTQYSSKNDIFAYYDPAKPPG
jgi:hypothetical protein